MEKKVGFMSQCFGDNQKLKQAFWFSALNPSFLCTSSVVFITWYFNWIYVFACQWSGKYMLYQGFLNLLEIQKEKVSDALYLPHGYTALDKHQKFLTKTTRFPNVIQEQLFYDEGYWNSLEVKDGVNGVETMFEGTLEPLFALTLRSHAFPLCLFPHCKVACICKCSFIW